MLASVAQKGDTSELVQIMSFFHLLTWLFPKVLIDLFSKHLLSTLDTLPGVGDTAMNKTDKNSCAPEAYILVKRERDQKQKIMHILAGSVEKKQQG